MDTQPTTLEYTLELRSAFSIFGDEGDQTKRDFMERSISMINHPSVTDARPLIRKTWLQLWDQQSEQSPNVKDHAEKVRAGVHKNGANGSSPTLPAF